MQRVIADGECAVVASAPNVTLTQDTIEALDHILQDTIVAHRDLLSALDRIEAVQWPQRDQLLADVVAATEQTLWKLSVRITRIAARARDAMQPLQVARNNKMDGELVASFDRSDQPPMNLDIGPIF